MTTVTSGLRSIKGRIRRLIDAPRQLGPQLVTVPIDRCRHYNGYKYGSSAFNPYENYIVGLHQKTDREALRQRFEDFLRYFRPRHFGELLQVPLANQVPMWVYPWDAQAVLRPNGGWFDAVEDLPDIITHFCEAGIQRSKIEGEYFWLERAYETIATMGYQPRRFSYITVRELRREGESVFVVTDGNHRLSALTAFGHKDVVVARDDRETIDASGYATWPQVVSRLYSPAEAQVVFGAYFTGIDSFQRATTPARILD
jgi:hypothetical protein